MTTETRPWLQDEGADPALKELLESTEFDGPSERQLEKLTARVAFLFDLPPGGGEGGGGGGGPSAPAAPAGGAATVAATSGVVKAIVAAGVISVGAVVATVTLREPAAPPIVVAPTPVIATAPVVPKEPEPAIAPAIVEPAKAPPPPVVRPAVVRPAPAPPPVDTKPAPPPPPSPDAELTALDDAIAAARAGRPAQALVAVEAHVASWPDSPLAQEREVIAIEALLSLGRRDDARTRLSAFRSKWPTSTHLVRLESMLPQ
ncbi:MAG: hypothetical protein GQE15_19635 [Archangiaceae bacterium]|nr:hypothetical protein [Archangiaceae bacterium]